MDQTAQSSKKLGKALGLVTLPFGELGKVIFGYLEDLFEFFVGKILLSSCHVDALHSFSLKLGQGVVLFAVASCEIAGFFAFI